jgi:hypothetical protein
MKDIAAVLSIRPGLAATIEFKDGKIEMESYGSEPFRLTNISSK